MIEPSFLQSPEWENFERSLGRDTRRAAGALVIRRDLPFGLNYLYCPRPDIGDMQHATCEKFLAEAEEIAVHEQSLFLKVDPSLRLPCLMSHVSCLMSYAIQPRETLILDIAQKSANEIRAAMREKTRYNIRLAERKNVQIKNFTPIPKFGVGAGESGIKGEQAFDTFWSLIQKTAARDGFRTHPREYYKKLLGIRSERFSNELFIAEYHGQPLAAALINFYGGTATYLHGASSGEHREVMAPHLLHWRIIEEAMRRGYKHYDWWGIDERRWPGVTRFKRGFGGREIAYPPSVNIVYRPVWYSLYAVAKRGNA